MAFGIFDGHNIEDRSTPLIKLEVDVVTLDEFNAFKNGLFNDLNARVIALEHDHPDLMAHLLKPISTAHSGFIDVNAQIPDNSINALKCTFPVFTLGIAHNQAAYGDHLHDDRYAKITDVENTYVTLNTNQTITGIKTFTNAVYVNSQNFETQDQLINLNAGYLASGGNFRSGMSIWNPLDTGTGYATGKNIFFVYESSTKRFKRYAGALGNEEETLAYVSDVADATNKPNGSATLPGAGAFVEVNLTSAMPGYTLSLSIQRASGNITADVGDYWYVRVNDSRFRLYNSGINNYDTIVWRVN